MSTAQLKYLRTNVKFNLPLLISISDKIGDTIQYFHQNLQNEAMWNEFSIEDIQVIFGWISRRENNIKSYSILLHFLTRKYPYIDTMTDTIINIINTISDKSVLTIIALILLFLPIDKVSHQNLIFPHCWKNNPTRVYFLGLLFSILTKNPVSLRRVLAEEICILIPTELLHRLINNISIIFKPYELPNISTLLSLPPPFSPLEVVKTALVNKYNNWIVLYIFQELLKEYKINSNELLKSIFLQLINTYYYSPDLIKVIDEYINYSIKFITTDTKLRLTEEEITQAMINARKSIIYYTLKYNADLIKHILKNKTGNNLISAIHTQTFIDSIACYNVLIKTWGNSIEDVIALACACSVELPIITFNTHINTSDFTEDMNFVTRILSSGTYTQGKKICTWLNKLQLHGYKWAREFLLLLTNKYPYKNLKYNFNRYVLHPCCCIGFSPEAYNDPVIARIITEIIEVYIVKYERYVELSMKALYVPERNFEVLIPIIVICLALIVES